MAIFLVGCYCPFSYRPLVVYLWISSAFIFIDSGILLYIFAAEIELPLFWQELYYIGWSFNGKTWVLIIDWLLWLGCDNWTVLLMTLFLGWTMAVELRLFLFSIFMALLFIWLCVLIMLMLQTNLLIISWLVFFLFHLLMDAWAQFLPIIYISNFLFANYFKYISN